MRRSSTGTIAPELSRQMSGQMAAEPAAMRVMSRNPPAARRMSASLSTADSAASDMSVAEVR